MRLNCRNGYVTAKNRGVSTQVTYCRPKNKNDLKRLGRELAVYVGNIRVVFNGKQLRSIKKVLTEVGEI